MTDRLSTHSYDCWSWGPKHYECAVGEIERLRKLCQDGYRRGYQAGSRGLREMYDAIQEVKRHDAWDNTRLTEALLAAEERAERAEAENERLREELDQLRQDAARYRWLRDPCSGAERVIFYCRGDYGRGLMSSAMLDAAIDDAIQRESGRRP